MDPTGPAYAILILFIQGRNANDMAKDFKAHLDLTYSPKTLETIIRYLRIRLAVLMRKRNTQLMFRDSV